jgi:hypothetical protein
MNFSANKMPDFTNSGLKALISCPLCQAHYQPIFSKTIQENDEAHLLHLECHQCGSQVLAFVRTDLPAISSIGLVTDLKSEEVKKFQEAEEIGINEVIDLHFLLNKNAWIF